MNMKNKTTLFAAFLLLPALLGFHSVAHALTAGTSYTIAVEKLKADGTLTSVSGGDTLGVSTTVTADANGKIAFTLSNMPNNTTCNFLTTTVTDNSSNTVVRRSVAPCPNVNATMPMGVSPLTNSQADAMIAAAAAAATDDPILVLFGFAIVRSSSPTSAELSSLATMIKNGISGTDGVAGFTFGTDGYVQYLLENGVTTAQLATYRTEIVKLLANKTTGYSKFIKDSVDAATAAAASDARGEAAGKLFGFLVTAAATTGFSPDRVMEAFDAMGAVVVPLLTAATPGTISNATSQGVNSNVGGALQRLKADRAVDKYTRALTTMGATGTDLTQFQNAGTTLVNSMTAAIKAYEAVFTGSETQAEVSAAETTNQTAMQNAFNAFITALAASGAATDTVATTGTRIGQMIANIDTALGTATGLTGASFQFFKSDGTAVMWPINMVIMTDFFSTVKTNGGDVTYTRAGATSPSIPSTITWIGTCSVVNNFNNQNKANCESTTSGVGVWTAVRTSIAGIPTPYKTLFDMKQDIEILEFTRFAATGSGASQQARAVGEKAMSDGLAAMALRVSGQGRNGSTALTTAEKEALVTLMQSPQF